MAEHNLFRKGFRLERWRVVTWFRWYRGLGEPKFEFEFRLGKPKRWEWPPLGEVWDEMEERGREPVAPNGPESSDG